MKLNNAKLFLLIGLLLATADANADQCTKAELKKGCRNLDVSYRAGEENSNQALTATACGGESLAGDEIAQPKESFCIKANTRVQIAPVAWATDYVDEKTIDKGLKVTCHGKKGFQSSNCEVVHY